MYKFVVIKGSCGQPYDISECERAANKMARNGFEFVQAYQSVVNGCIVSDRLCGPSSALVMVFKASANGEGAQKAPITEHTPEPDFDLEEHLAGIPEKFRE